MANPNGSSPLPLARGMDRIMEWNRDLPSLQPSCVHDLLDHNLCNQPNAPAICAWDRQYSYAELDSHASRLAYRLVQIGAGTEQFVPLCFEKSAFAVISLIAVLKAGAAGVFLDPAHPIERIGTMVKDVRANILLCSPSTRPQFNVEAFRNLYFLEVTEGLLNYLPALKAKLPSVRPEDAAIGLFTSGSTGKPKGIIQNHSTAAFSAQTCSNAFGISVGSRVLQWAAYCFDMSVIDMLMTLVGGGCICIPSEKDKTDNLVQTMQDMRINFAAMTPSFAQTIKSEEIGDLQTLVLGGEPVSKDHLAGWPNDLRIINAYGPAEGSVCVVGLANSKCPANVGKAVGSTTWIADEADPMQLVSFGAIGELLIEGPLLARGYLNDPQKTAASFLEDPPWLVCTRGVSQTPRRVYKTGDLARYDESGSIVLMGRKDTQIKLRGQRIETAEIEYSMNTLLPIGFTVIVDVTSPAFKSESQILVAFIGAGSKTQSCSDDDLLSIDDHLKTKLVPLLQDIEGRLPKSLPAYMIPSYFIPLQYIPLTSSGKVDRKRLKYMGSNLTSTQIQSLSVANLNGDSKASGAHENFLQEKLAELWILTLGLQTRKIDSSSDFFRLGGDSVVAMKLVTAARNAGLDISTKQIFEHRTLAAMTSAARPVQYSGDLPSSYKKQRQTTPNHREDSLEGIFCPNNRLLAVDIEEIVDATDMQAFMVVCGLLRSHGYINYFAFDLQGDIDPDQIEFACKTLVKRHSALRTVFAIRDGRVIQIMLKKCEIEFQRLSSQSPTNSLLTKLCETEKKSCSQFGDQIVRFVLIERESKKYTLIMRISHAQFDGTSLALIYSDLQNAYNGQALDAVSQFTDFSRAVERENNQAAENYWRNLLRGSSITSIVNHTKPCYANVINDKIYLTLPFTGIGRSDITLATVVKAAWALLLAEIASTRDVVFGYAVTGREIPLHGVDRIVGDCNNAALARVLIKETDSILDLLNRIQAQYVDTIPYQSMGLRQMVEKCTDWPRWTRYSTSVNHQNYVDAGIESFEIGGVDCKVSYKDLEVDRRDVQVYSWPLKDGQMKIAMAFCNQIVPQGLAQGMLERLGRRIQSFSEDVNAPLAVSSDSFCRIPLSIPPSLDRTISGSVPQPRFFSFPLLNPTRIASSVWERFLSSCSRDLLVGFDVTDDLPFYTFAGDLVHAAQMSAFYEEGGIGFSMELLFENATKRSQVKLLESVLA